MESQRMEKMWIEIENGNAQTEMQPDTYAVITRAKLKMKDRRERVGESTVSKLRNK